MAVSGRRGSLEPLKAFGHDEQKAGCLQRTQVFHEQSAAADARKSGSFFIESRALEACGDYASDFAQDVLTLFLTCAAT